MRRSTSPPTSASTLSSSFNGGGGGSGVGVGDITADKVANNERKDEWAGVTELQPIPGSLERCGLGLEEWENMLSESGQEQSLLRWIAGDVDDNSCFTLKHMPQSGNNPLDFDENGGQMWSVDQGPVFESANGVVTGNLAAVTSSGFAMSRSDSQSAGLVSTSSSSGRVNYSSNNNDSGLQNPLFGSQASTVVYNHYQQQPIEVPEKKPLIINSQAVVNQQQPHLLQLQGANFLMPLPLSQQDNHLYQPQFKRQNSGIVDPNPQLTTKVPFSDPGQEFLVRKHNQPQQQQQQQQQHLGYSQSMHPHFLQKPVVVMKDIGIQQHQQQQQQLQNALLDQLYKASELVGTGNFSHAQGILARLNQQLSPIGKPLNRAAFYFKEALQLLLLMNSNSVAALPPRSPTPFDVIFKMGAYKVFSEMSPLIQFANFTCNQALLEALDDADRIHIIDFDVGFGAQWASFMQELPQSRGTRSLKITAIASPSTHHPLELRLMQENLTQFANEIGIGFELDVINIDSLEQNCFSLPIFRQIEKEAIAVNFPIWSCSHNPSALPSLLRFVKQLSPKIVVSLDRGCDRPDLPFPQHILHALQCYIHLLESLDTVNGTSDTVNKIERFLLQPRIESSVLGRLRAPDKMPSWKTLFASAGFSSISFSNFTETLAESIAKRTQARGFQVEKRQALLVLCWQNRDLISASAWRC